MLLITFVKGAIAIAIGKEMEKRSVDAEGNKIATPEKELVELNRKATLCAARKVLTIWLNRQYTGGNYSFNCILLTKAQKDRIGA